MPLAASAVQPGRVEAAPRRRALVVGDGGPARDAARILAAEAWRVTRSTSLAEATGGERLDEAAVVILEAGGDLSRGLTERRNGDAPLSRLSPETAVLVLADGQDTRRDFAAFGPERPRFVHVPPHPDTLRSDTLLAALEAELGYRRLLRENRILRRELRDATRLDAWVGCSEAAAEIRSAITTTAFGEGPVLIVGESGSGRQLAARLVHRLGREATLPFLALHAASLPAGELGAILASLRERSPVPGPEGAAPRPGSLYLSGVEALHSRDQVVLEDAVSRPPPFRLLVSASPGLSERARAERFRRPLLRRIQGSTIRIPPLRQRREDIPALVLHFLSESGSSGPGSERPPFGLSPGALEACRGYAWPGNTAELRAWVERAVATARVSRFEGTLLPETACPPPGAAVSHPDGAGSRPLREILADMEKNLIERALRRTRGNQKRAAQALRLNPTTLHEKMKRHGLLRRARRSAPPAPAELPVAGA